MNWEYLREEEFEGAIARSKGVCVLPIGCLEKHGQHLPVGTDSLTAIRTVEDAAAIEEVVVFPTGMWLGDVCGYHKIQDPVAKRKRGGIGINPQTQMTVLGELCDEIARNGFSKILIVNAHGGNSALLSLFNRATYYNKKDYALVWTGVCDPKVIRPESMYPIVMDRIQDFPYLTEADLEAMRKFAETGAGGGHADWRETARMMYYHPETVAEDRFDAEDGTSTHLADHLKDAQIWGGMIWGANFPNSYEGYPPFGCSANIGRAMHTLCVERMVNIFKTLKDDEFLVNYVRNR